MSAELSQTIDEIDELLEDEAYDRAKERLATAFQEHGENPELISLQALLNLRQEDYDGVISCTDKFLQDIEDKELLAAIHNTRGLAYYYMDDLELARKEQNESVRLSPNDYDTLVGRALVHEELDFLNAAYLDLKRALQLDDSDPQAHSLLASIWMRWGETEKAYKEYETAFELDEEDLDSALEVARFYTLEGNTDDAMDILTTILSSDIPDEEIPSLVAPAALLRSQLSLAMGSTDPALEDAQRAQNVIPDLPWAYLQTAAVKIHAQIDPEGALEALKKAEEAVGDIRDLPDLYRLYAGVYQMLDNEEKVREYLEMEEGTARLPRYVYGSTNPASNVPLNPNRPLDYRLLLDQLFGEASKAPEGYEEALRTQINELIRRIPEIRRENPEMTHIQLQIPPIPGMVIPGQTITIELSQSSEQA